MTSNNNPTPTDTQQVTTTPTSHNNNNNTAAPAINSNTSSPTNSSGNTTTTNNNTTKQEGEAKQQQQNKKTTKQRNREYNPRWKGYTAIFLSSLINLSSTSNVQSEFTNNFRYGGDSSYIAPISNYEGTWAFNMSFASVTIAFATLVLLADRTGFGIPKKNGDDNNSDGDVYNYAAIWDGKLEGYCLLICVVWWIIGVAYQTQVHGIAYLAMNIYCSSWLSLLSCVYTLEQWSVSKDILSFQELTGISATLKSWYVLFLSSIVVTGTSINMFVLPYLNNIDENDDEVVSTGTQLFIDTTAPAAFGIAFGIASTVVSFGFILVHYNLIELCSEGGWIELIACFAVSIMWIIGTAMLTKYGGVGATLVGIPYQYIYVPNTVVSTNYGSNLNGSTFEYVSKASNNDTDTTEESCVLFYNNTAFLCDEFIPYNALQKEAAVPGSNLYLSVWACLLSSVNIAFRWKAEQALQFAHAQEERAYQETTRAVTGSGDEMIQNNKYNDSNNSNNNVQRDDESNVDDDDDDDEFLDSDSF